jgi:hypothetical protein
MKIRDWIILFTLLLLASACSEATSQAGEVTTPTPTSTPLLSDVELVSQPEDNGTCSVEAESDEYCELEAVHNPPVLDGDHEGWKTQDCKLCHELPRIEHMTAIVWECAACHGGNGACEPPEFDEHSEEVACFDCHDPAHGLDQTTACTSCHFDEKGTDECSPTIDDVGTAILGLASASKLVSGCRSQADEAGLQIDRPRITAMLQGEPAVDFALKDIGGNTYTLSGLLETKPALLVLGGFT